MKTETGFSCHTLSSCSWMLLDNLPCCNNLAKVANVSPSVQRLQWLRLLSYLSETDASYHHSFGLFEQQKHTAHSLFYNIKNDSQWCSFSTKLSLAKCNFTPAYKE